MKTQEELRRSLRGIDHKGYKAYKVLEGSYDFGSYTLCIDHVQGDPFATPSRVRILYHNRGNIEASYYSTRCRRVAVEDYLLRRLHRALSSDGRGNAPSPDGRGNAPSPEGRGNAPSSEDSAAGRREHEEALRAAHGSATGRREHYSAQSAAHGSAADRHAHLNAQSAVRGSGNAPMSEDSAAGRHAHGEALRAARGSGKSGLVTAGRAGQEVLERTAMRISREEIEARLEVGFPAFGRTIAADELAKILFEQLPDVAKQAFSCTAQMIKDLDQVTSLADDQQYIRDHLEERGLVAFVADGAVLPRESGISQRPMKNAVPFVSPESLSVTMDLPHRGSVRGMGVKKGITVIAGGGFHGKSTLLKALERGVYNHIAGDGRELVITDTSAYKLRAEEGRCIHDTDISLFIDNLPNGADTACFSTENASGSTSQAANTVEALACRSRLLLIDEDTSATNFMVRDARMAQLVSDEKEPITPFIRKVKSLYKDLGVSTVLVVGSSGDYLSVADTVLQMDCYVAKDVTARAKQISGEPAADETIAQRKWLKKPVRARRIEKARVRSRDAVSLDKAEIDLRGLEQITDESQTAALAYLMQYILEHLADGKKTAEELAREASDLIEKEGILAVTPKNYGAGAAAAVREQEILSCLTRYRAL